MTPVKATRHHAAQPRAGSSDQQDAQTARGRGYGRYLFWGWLRLVLGIAQMALVGAAVVAFLYGGLSDVTVGCFLAASAATLLSRVLYHGRHQPDGDQEP